MEVGIEVDHILTTVSVCNVTLKFNHYDCGYDEKR